MRTLVGAVTFEAALAGVQTWPEVHARGVGQCLEAFAASREDLAGELPTLAKMWRESGKTQGQVVIAVLKAGPPTIHAKGAPFGKSRKAPREAARLYADCYLALSEWCLAWNRKQIKRV